MIHTYRPDCPKAPVFYAVVFEGNPVFTNSTSHDAKWVAGWCTWFGAWEPIKQEPDK